MTSPKKGVTAPFPRKVKRLPLREELDILRAALPPEIRSHLGPPRDDKGCMYPTWFLRSHELTQADTLLQSHPERGKNPRGVPPMEDHVQ